MSFIFGGDTGITYEQLKQRRKMADQLRAQNSRTPRNVGEGIHSIARALVARGTDKLNTERAAELKEQYSGLWDGLLGATGGGSYVGSGATGQTPGSFVAKTPEQRMGLDMGESPESAAAGQNPTIEAGGKTWDMGRPVDIGSQLMADLQRDLELTPAQAAGVVGNLAHESGDFKSLQEVSPLVPGSKGGFGYAQWTGPRRRAFEAWTQANNLDPTSYEANYGFLKHELLNTPEGSVMDSLRQAQSPTDAAQVFSNKFLRPGIPHMDSRLKRAAQYAGGDYQPSPQGGVRTAQAGGIDPSVIQLAQMLSAPDEFMPPGQKAVAQALLERKLAGSQPLTPLQQQQFQMNEMKMAQMGQPQAPDVVDINGVDHIFNSQTGEYEPLPIPEGGGIEKPAAFAALKMRAAEAGLTPGTPEYETFMLNAGGDPATFRALDMQAQAAGLAPGTPEYANFMATRGAGQQAYAKGTGANRADIETGGQAAEAVAEGSAQGKRNVEGRAELAEMERNLPGLREVVGELYKLSDEATYTLAGQALDYTRSQLGAEPRDAAVARAKYIAMVDNQVLPLLRQTFGAAFTVKEGETLRETLGAKNKSPAEKKAVLDAFIAQKERDIRARGGKIETPATSSDMGKNPYTGISDAEFGQIDLDELTPLQLKQLMQARGIQ